jgi:ATP-dependent DNA helicase DinG
LLAQGAGRLIRRGDDRGVVAVLDPRLATNARYRWDIIRALPPMRRTKDRAEAEAFLRSLGSASEQVARNGNDSASQGRRSQGA